MQHQNLLGSQTLSVSKPSNRAEIKHRKNQRALKALFADSLSFKYQSIPFRQPPLLEAARRRPSVSPEGFQRGSSSISTVQLHPHRKIIQPTKAHRPYLQHSALLQITLQSSTACLLTKITSHDFLNVHPIANPPLPLLKPSLPSLSAQQPWTAQLGLICTRFRPKLTFTLAS